MGSGLGGSGTIVDQIGIRATRGPDRLSPFFIPMSIANIASGQTAMSFGAMGPNFATGERLCHRRARHRRGGGDDPPWGRRDHVRGRLGGGHLRGDRRRFAAMRALSTRNDDPTGASRPFDRAGTDS